ncbi:MAG: response regulator [Gemmatirosa sp.]|nr:response regulator [Gemmatirosa sp.]
MHQPPVAAPSPSTALVRRRSLLGRGPLGVRGLLVLLVCAVLAPFLVGAALRIRERAREARTAAGRRALDAARLVAERLDERARNTHTLLAAVAHQVRTDPAGAAANDSLLFTIRRDLPDSTVTNLWVADTAGANIGTSFRPVPARMTVGVRDRRFFRDVMATRRFAIGDPVRSRPDTTTWSVTYAQPVLSERGEVHAVVLGSLHLRSLDATLRLGGLPHGSTITVVDSRGIVVARGPDGTGWIGRDVRARIKGALTRTSGVTDMPGSDGKLRLGAFMLAPTTGWRVFVAIPTAVAYVDVGREVRRELLLGVATLALALGLAVTIGGRIVAPVEALAADAKALAAGEYERRSPTDVPREIATLAATFNEMAGTIAARTAALHRTEQRYRLLFDACPLPLYLADLETHRILAVNAAACVQYGYTRDEFLRLGLLDLRPADDRLRFLAVTRALDKAHGLHERANAGIWRHVHRDGSIVEVEVFTARTEFEGQPVRLSVALDVTARRRAERQLQESQDQLRRAQKMEALGRFAGGIAHDFNNLLTGILGYCDLALSDDGLGDETREDFSAIRSAAQRAAGLTSQILAFSRGRAVQAMALDLNTVVGELQPMLARMIGEHIRLVSALSPTAGVVHADPGQMEQVIMNLALNARDAMPDGGTLTIATSDVSVDVDDPRHPGVAYGRWTVLDVRDTGIGMDAETQARVFEPFFTTKERARGTGLGLATVYGIVRQSSGTVRVSSQPGAGSRFSIYLPRVDAPADERRLGTPPVANVAGGRETILLVEDEDAVRTIVRETLTRRGYRVLSAPDGPRAVEVARDHDGEIDLLLTDVVMPGMNGRELAERLTRQRPGLRVLFMSGYTEDEVLHRGVSADEMALLDKPFTPDALGAHVRAVLDAGRLIPA